METDRDRKILKLAAKHGDKYQGDDLTIANFPDIVGHEPDLSTPGNDDLGIISYVRDVVTNSDHGDYRLYRFQSPAKISEERTSSSKFADSIKNFFVRFRKK